MELRTFSLILSPYQLLSYKIWVNVFIVFILWYLNYFLSVVLWEFVKSTNKTSEQSSTSWNHYLCRMMMCKFCFLVFITIFPLHSTPLRDPWSYHLIFVACLSFFHFLKFQLYRQRGEHKNKTFFVSGNELRKLWVIIATKRRNNLSQSSDNRVRLKAIESHKRCWELELCLLYFMTHDSVVAT